MENNRYNIQINDKTLICQSDNILANFSYALSLIQNKQKMKIVVVSSEAVNINNLQVLIESLSQYFCEIYVLKRNISSVVPIAIKKYECDCGIFVNSITKNEIALFAYNGNGFCIVEEQINLIQTIIKENKPISYINNCKIYVKSIIKSYKKILKLYLKECKQKLNIVCNSNYASKIIKNILIDKNINFSMFKHLPKQQKDNLLIIDTDSASIKVINSGTMKSTNVICKQISKYNKFDKYIIDNGKDIILYKNNNKIKLSTDLDYSLIYCQAYLACKKKENKYVFPFINQSYDCLLAFCFIVSCYR